MNVSRPVAVIFHQYNYRRDGVLVAVRVDDGQYKPVVAGYQRSRQCVLSVAGHQLNKAIVDSILRPRCTLPSPFPADNAFSMGKKTPSRRQAMRPIVNVSEEDRATDTGNTYKNFVTIARVVLATSWRRDRQTHRQTHGQTCSSQYFATAPASEVINRSHALPTTPNVKPYKSKDVAGKERPGSGPPAMTRVIRGIFTNQMKKF